MILEGNQRGGAKNLALHLVKPENDHVEIHEIRGFASDNLMGALNEAYAISRGTKATQFLYSLSLNPPSNAQVSIAEFEEAIDRAEKTLSLTGHPRAIVFHEKVGRDSIVRRHAHAVWSRIDVKEMKAVNMGNDRPKLTSLSREIYLEKGWKMPRGFAKSSERDYRNYTQAEWEQAKRSGKDPRAIKTAIADAWAISDSKAGFQHALKERGYVLARGDRKGFMAVDIFGEAYPIRSKINSRIKQIRARLGDEQDTQSIAQAKTQIAKEMSPTMQRLKGEIYAQVKQQQQAYDRDYKRLVKTQREERKTLKQHQLERSQREAVERQSRFRKGFRGIWDRVNGEHKRISKLNEKEAQQTQKRDRKEQDSMIFTHVSERQMLKQRATIMSKQHQSQIRVIERDMSRYRGRGMER